MKNNALPVEHGPDFETSLTCIEHSAGEGDYYKEDWSVSLLFL